MANSSPLSRKHVLSEVLLAQMTGHMGLSHQVTAGLDVGSEPSMAMCVTDLPAEALLRVFCFLNPTELQACAGTDAFCSSQGTPEAVLGLMALGLVMQRCARPGGQLLNTRTCGGRNIAGFFGARSPERPCLQV